MGTRVLSLVVFVICVYNIQYGYSLKAHRVFVPHFNPDGRIIGGNESVPHSLPYSVGLIINGHAFCGGSLISPNYVLTAAHCGTVIYRAEIILGAHNITEIEPTQVRFNVDYNSVISHINFSMVNYHNDIALIKLPKSVRFDEYIQPISLPTRKDFNRTYVDLQVKASGWGLVHDKPNAGVEDISDVLRYVVVDGMRNEDCEEYYNLPGKDYVYDGNFCTSGYTNKGTCGGDSGGPVVYDGVQIGLTTFGAGECEVCTPSVFTNLAKHLDWIEQNSDTVIH